jgi:hypothetical protein
MGLFSKKKTEIDLISEINLDLETFEFIGIEKPKKSSEFKVYRKSLNELQFGIFENIEVYLFENGSKNVFLTNDINNTNYDNLKLFVNQLVKKHGQDFVGSAELDEDEIDNIAINNFWLGRTWDTISPIIAIDGIDQENFKLSILGIK